jgi:O-acetyl-ADP-ribose deacetylase (regulator of RNase III)
MRAIRQSDILNDPADALVYSTNVLFNCTGGVGGALLMRYGAHVQKELHALLSARSERFMKQGDVIDHVPYGLPYRHLLHTFPCDGMYDTSTDIVEDVLRRALQICIQDQLVSRVAVSALATGYGHMALDDFIPIAARVFNDPDFAAIPQIVLCLPDDPSFTWTQQVIREFNLALAEDTNCEQ